MTVVTSPSSIVGPKVSKNDTQNSRPSLCAARSTSSLRRELHRTLAVKHVTTEIPIVFAAAGDPVGTGLVTSLARPGGNLTGLSNQQTDLAAKRLDLLSKVVPNLRRLAVMGNVHSPNVVLEMNEVQSAGSRFGMDVAKLEITKTEDIIPGIDYLGAVSMGFMFAPIRSLRCIEFASTP